MGYFNINHNTSTQSFLYTTNYFMLTLYIKFGRWNNPHANLIQCFLNNLCFLERQVIENRIQPKYFPSIRCMDHIRIASFNIINAG